MEGAQQRNGSSFSSLLQHLLRPCCMHITK
jgi:hypothetical protein